MFRSNSWHQWVKVVASTIYFKILQLHIPAFHQKHLVTLPEYKRVGYFALFSEMAVTNCSKINQKLNSKYHWPHTQIWLAHVILASRNWISKLKNVPFSYSRNDKILANRPPKDLPQIESVASSYSSGPWFDSSWWYFIEVDGIQ